MRVAICGEEAAILAKKWIGIIQITLSLVIVIGLAMGCGVPSSTSGSKYPVDISGRVTIIEKLLVNRSSHCERFLICHF